MIPLHTHSNYSMLRGTASIDDLLKKAREYSLPALALTDTNGMYGLIQFYKAAKEHNIKPLAGAYIDEPGNEDIYALFIARNNRGYGELCRIITSRKLKDDFSLFTLLKNELPDLFIITHSLELLKAVPPGENVFAELIAAGNYKKSTRRIFNYARENGIKYIASNPVYFAEREDYIIHKTVTAIRERSTVANIPDDMLVDEEFYFREPDYMHKLWRKLPEALRNIDYIVNNSNVDLELGKVKFPTYETTDHRSQFSLLWKLAFEGLEKRYRQLNDKIIKRLKYELEVIEELGFTDYFLVVWDILREAKQRGMMTLGRGSAGNSLISYSLGFTDVDPIKHNLYFERFLNRGRTTPPDIDLDFSWKERDQIVKYVFEKYGYDRVAMISTTVTFRARSAFRETAKVFGISENEISEYSKFIPWTDARNLASIAAMFPEARSLKFESEPWKSIVTIASKLAGFPRHLSIHPGGIVIAPGAITDYTALEYAKNKGVGLIVTQPDMYPIEDLGLIKIDLLSQRSLGVLRDTVKQIQEG